MSIEGSANIYVLKLLPLSLRSRAKVILDHLKKNISRTWNDKGEIIADGNLSTGYNIIDLIKVHLKDYKSLHTVGEKVFSQLVPDSNIPLSVLTQGSRCQFGSEKIPPHLENLFVENERQKLLDTVG